MRLSARRQRLLCRLFQALIAAILVVGLVSRNLSVVVNATLAFVATFVPELIDRDYNISLDTGFILWVSVALFLHTLGMLGLYDNVWWYDHVTHTLSATIVAAVGYVSARAVAEQDDTLYLPPKFLFVYIFLFTLALGVMWEVLEFGARIGAGILGLEPVLIQYGLNDSLLDLVFNTVGAFLVAIFGIRRASGVVEQISLRLSERRKLVDISRDETVRLSSMRTGLESLLESASTNTRLAWLIIICLVVTVLSSVLRGRALQTIFILALLVLALIPPLLTRDLQQMLPWELLLIAALPIIGYTFSLSFVSDISTYFAVAAVALVVAVELHIFTAVRMTPGFAVFFVIIATMATAAVWAVCRWVSDLYLGTQLLLTPGIPDEVIETQLMWEFVYSTLAGVGAGVLYERAFRKRAYDIN